MMYADRHLEVLKTLQGQRAINMSHPKFSNKIFSGGNPKDRTVLIFFNINLNGNTNFNLNFSTRKAKIYLF